MNANTFQAKLRSDKRKNPQMRRYRLMTFDELKASNGKHLLYLDRHDNIATVRVTTIKTWKTRPEIEIHCKFGMYEYFTDTIRPTDDKHNFVVEVNE